MGEKRFLSLKNNFSKYPASFFWMLQGAKYLICDFTFTFSFTFICSKLNWPLFYLSGIFACRKKDGQG